MCFATPRVGLSLKINKSQINILALHKFIHRTKKIVKKMYTAFVSFFIVSKSLQRVKMVCVQYKRKLKINFRTKTAYFRA